MNAEQTEDLAIKARTIRNFVRGMLTDMEFLEEQPDYLSGDQQVFRSIKRCSNSCCELAELLEVLSERRSACRS
jgi:hypothetical protein